MEVGHFTEHKSLKLLLREFTNLLKRDVGLSWRNRFIVGKVVVFEVRVRQSIEHTNPLFRVERKHLLQ